ncbi:PTS-dependent dihydroxyacetone kinase phosphotransferase subunit DhaM [Enterococcus sp. DIV0242_7C1]|uniref:phosphoenolpyruvate--glycerone phosphotransferase n=1 Tax=Candidatus Enterococcus dunnyi TaxID=1834192 RepID=A0A200IZ84_9ENTE|nr:MULTISPECIES: dihydroxyacetone kinase phosphoryl donor subunit DhaM [unclassified Enterococcus]MBO0470347.1 PTS-dependent dihydroxyacetone kinase phosphotransferase subunit DhaM [Enterococcus sp. DIV0242_7C1]MCA5014243.1 PTS-dependent dihydroxyacetone kinase phosphotransferase subunit DhaM [Enterococcus sp. S23]MCA5017535.1 PTS-dependent dihydroxyacetone kinase phosphotransferase subunit DhaM [Enterococcus sp. S22(2020)]OUZ30284.1 dihydroxyacetone kinase, phosphotransfer subunit [Enterococcu
MTSGIVIVSHVKEIGEGVDRLIKEVAKDVPITVAAGLDQGEVGTSFERIMAAFEENPAQQLLAFYDLGSAKMNLEMAIDMTEKEVLLFDTALVESAYTAAALLQVDTPLEAIEEQLVPLKIK